MYARPTLSEWIVQTDELTVRTSVNLTALEACWREMGLTRFPAIRWGKHPYGILANSYDPDHQRITIDVEGCTAYIIARSKGNVRVTEDYLTMSFAHESRHAWQHQRFGQWFMKHDHIRYAGMLLLVLAWLWFGCMWLIIKGGTVPSFLGLVALVSSTAIARYRFNHWVVRMFHRFTYQKNWIERDAYRYALTAWKTSPWNKVVCIEPIQQPPMS